jgi:hypothetical protein
MVFIDLEKAYNKVPRNIIWRALQKHKVSTKYITLIKDMYDNVVTSVRTSCKISSTQGMINEASLHRAGPLIYIYSG